MDFSDLIHPRPATRSWPYRLAALLGRAWRTRPSVCQAEAEHADVLVRALLQGLPTFPIDGIFDPADELIIDDSAEIRRYVIPLGPGRTTWLHRLIATELATHRNARPGGNGHCEHCHGTGFASPF
ncbi:hypothetical protein [Nonomuraea turcica]|uniref:hypothetical protein n=1 Tax=Nonomuraea sp. G32 TaxID=3067274 RepID=UPI00273B8078|nr:hypothetical protein [Nonomuraea sp. G32]MDP4510337.1 hypothetical protein [Nonomuraea sp. G32]